MADLVANSRTKLPPQEVIVRAVQFFTNEKWRAQTQSERTATFAGTPAIPWGLLFLTFIGFLFFVIPGIILYLLAIRKARRLQNLVVTANPIPVGSEVVINYPKAAKKMVDRFLSALPAAGGQQAAGG